MKKTALVAALFAVACLSLSAQVETKKKKQATSETVYVVKIAGIGG